MKTIFKLFTLLLIAMLAIPVIAADDNTMPDNYTCVDNYTESSVDKHINNNEEVEDDINADKYKKHNDEVIADMEREYKQMDATDSIHTVCIDGIEYRQYWPSPEEINDLAVKSNAKGNYTFEQELIKYDDRIPFDTYVVTETDGSRHTVVVVYNNKKSHTAYGRSQFYADMHRVSVVTPAPMAICKPLYIKALNEPWNMKTAVVTSYKIVYSHYGREITDEVETTVPEVPEQHIQPINVPPHRVPDKNNNIDIDNSTVVENTTINNAVNTTETISNVTGDQTNTTTEIGDNSSNNVAVTGNGNIIKNVYIVISDKFNGFIQNLNINV